MGTPLKYFLLVCIIPLFSTCQTMTKKTTVNNFELDKYLGKWYEIARFDHSFEQGLHGVTANYTLLKKGKIKVTNAGYKNGIRREANGKAKVAKSIYNGHLKVSFFLFFYADYFVLELDDDYQWAIVGSSADSYLWILSRKPAINDALYNELVEKAKKRGYDTSKLIKVDQSVNIGNQM